MIDLRGRLSPGLLIIFVTVFAFGIAPIARSQGIAPETEAAIDEVVAKALADTNTPSASIAIARQGQIVLAKAYGDARLNPKTPATVTMRYKIGSNSKQFVASAILLLVERKKLALDDKVARFLPGLTRAKDITIRQLLNHTSGYQDYYAIDYVSPLLASKTAPTEIIDLYAKKKLDFEPGSRFQYSNTNYVVLGLIVEKVTGQALGDFLRDSFFRKAHMTTVIDLHRQDLAADDPLPYVNFGLGPLRVAVPEGNGWFFGAGQLAMSAEDLARWNIALMQGSMINPGSLKELTRGAILNDGSVSNYALGLMITQFAQGNRRWAHSGGVSGMLSSNVLYPDELSSITVLTNSENGAQQAISQGLEKLLIGNTADAQAAPSLERARAIFADLQHGQIDKAMITENLAAYFTEQALADHAASLRTLGEATEFDEVAKYERGGMVNRIYKIKAEEKDLLMNTYIQSDGRFEQALIRPFIPR